MEYVITLFCFLCKF